MNNHTNDQSGSSPAKGSRPSLSDRVRSLRIQDRPAAQPVGRWWLPWALCVVFAGAAVLFASRPPRVEVPPAGKDQVSEALKKLGASQDGPAGQTTTGPNSNLSPDTILLESKGYVVPVQTIQVSPKVSGMVLKLNLKEGQQVSKGDVLAILEKVEYQAYHDKIVAMAKAAEQRYAELQNYREEEKELSIAEHAEAKVLLQFLKSEWDRNESLWKTNAVSLKEYQQSKSDWEQMEEKVKRLDWIKKWKVKGPREETKKAAKAEWEQLEAEKVKAKWQLDNCTVLAPISGTILTKKAEEGNIVNSAAFNISASLCEMADLYNLEVELAIAERDISKIFKGQKCKVRPEAFPGRIYWGTVSRLMPTADRSKSSIPVRVKIHILPRPEDAKLSTVVSTLGLLAAPVPWHPLTVPTGFAANAVEPQAEYLRPDMGALVTFLNARAEME